MFNNSEGVIKMKRIQLFSVIPLILLVSGCAHVISKEVRENSDLSLTLSRVRENPDGFRGKSVVWGGEIIQVVNQEDGATEIEVFQRPLGYWGEPNLTTASEGKFLVLADGFLDPYIYQNGKKITIAGEITGEEMKKLGEMEYQYPLLASKKIYIWSVYYDSPYPYYYSYPWWGFGSWGLNFQHHRHHHHHHR